MPATFREAAEFYHSRQWIKCAEFIRHARHHICQRCGQPGSYVHHKIYLNPRNIKYAEITLNPDNLELLCHDCHEKEHGRLRESKEQKRKIIFDSCGNPMIKG